VETALTILLDGLVFSSYLFIVSLGLTIIFGVMKILNVTHGSFYAWGAYTAAFLIGLAANAGWPDWAGFAIIFFAAILVGLVLGLILERGILQFMYHRDEVLIVLATFGSFLVLEDTILLVFGVDPYFAFQPMQLLGAVELGGIARDTYGLTLIGLAAVLAAASWLVLRRTHWGKLLSAVIFDRELAMAMGLNVSRVYIVTFVIGAILGALGGKSLADLVAENESAPS